MHCCKRLSTWDSPGARFGEDGYPKKAIVEILDFDGLYHALNEKASCGDYGPITYTHSSDRNHFTKSVLHDWMYGYRLGS